MPDLIRDLRFHRRRHSEGLVGTAEIVERVPERRGGPVFYHFLEEVFVNLVQRRTPILKLKLLRTTMLVRCGRDRLARECP